jgi:hypothetical protein
MRHLALPDLEKNSPSAETHKVETASLHFQNAASALNASGKLLASQMPPTTSWMELAYSGWSYFSSVSREDPLLAATGSYIYLKPDSDDDLAVYRTPLRYLPGTTLPIASNYSIIEQTSYIATMVLVDAVAGQDATWNVAYGVEFETTDPWKLVELPSMEPEAYARALRELRDAPQVMENPEHLKTILNYVGKVARGVGKAAVTYLPLALQIAKQLKNT